MTANLDRSGRSAYQALEFMDRNTSFLRSLFANCNRDAEQLTTLIEPILNAPNRCEVAPYYIQAISTGSSTFLVTNISIEQTARVVDSAESWSIGRHLNCEIAMRDRCISRNHAEIGHQGGNNFYIADLGSKNGTKVNNSQLSPSQRCILSDGDLIELGFVQIEFFVATSVERSSFVDNYSLQ